MHRRTLVASAAALAAPRLARAQASRRVLRFVPQVDLASLDPIATTAQVTLIHGYAVFDTLYGLDSSYRVQPQMVEGHTIEDDGKLWTLTLREGLRFHDGEPVRGRDAVASIRRWGRQDSFGRALMAATAELSAPDDRTIRFRLRSPFPMLPAALSKAGSNMPCIMPERLAAAEPTRAVTEVTGSGPLRFVAGEWRPGSRVVYERFGGYVPRQGASSFTAGPKVVHFDRVEWHIIPDEATTAAALQTQEVDWRDWISSDFVPVFRRTPHLVVMPGTIPNMSILTVNHLHPPFDNPAIRRALLGAVNQVDFMSAAAGADATLWRTGTGMFNSASPMASDAGLEVLTRPRDLDRARREIAAAGYRNEPVVILDPADFPSLHALTLVGADMFRRIGLNVTVQTMDWGAVVQRRTNQDAPDKGGWSALFLGLTAFNGFDPAGNFAMRGNGRAAWFGWPTSPRIEALRDAWMNTGDFDRQKAICRDMQLQALEDVPYVPLGEYRTVGAHNASLVNVPGELPLFFNVRRA